MYVIKNFNKTFFSRKSERICFLENSPFFPALDCFESICMKKLVEESSEMRAQKKAKTSSFKSSKPLPTSKKLGFLCRNLKSKNSVPKKRFSPNNEKEKKDKNSIMGSKIGKWTNLCLENFPVFFRLSLKRWFEKERRKKRKGRTKKKEKERYGRENSWAPLLSSRRFVLIFDLIWLVVLSWVELSCVELIWVELSWVVLSWFGWLIWFDWLVVQLFLFFLVLFLFSSFFFKKIETREEFEEKKRKVANRTVELLLQSDELKEIFSKLSSFSPFLVTGSSGMLFFFLVWNVIIVPIIIIVINVPIVIHYLLF